MGYCFMTTQKIKSMGALTSKCIHNFRKIEISNADPDLLYKNETLVNSTDEYGNELDYVDAWKERMRSLPSYQEHGVRKNAVLAIEVVTTFSRESNINLEKWKEENVKWLEKTYNVAPDGKSNVLSVVYHADEPGNVHCHAIVVPVDENGRLNSVRFIGGRKALYEMQTDYGNAMKQFGLQRGLENGQARHQDIKKYYSELNNAIKVSLPKEQETALEYRDRVLEELETLQAAALRERNEQKRLMEREMALKRLKVEEKLSLERGKLYAEKLKMQQELQKDNKELILEIERNTNLINQQKKMITAATERLEGIQTKCDEQQELYDEIEVELKKLDPEKKKIRFYDAFQKQYQLLKEQDPSRAAIMQETMQYMSQLKENNKEL